MYNRKKLILGVAVVVAILLAISGNAHESAWTQGYLTGVAAASGDAPHAAPHLAHVGGFGLIGAMFKIFFMLLFFAFIFKMFGFMMWRRAVTNGGGDSEWAKAWRSSRRGVHGRCWHHPHATVSGSARDNDVPAEGDGLSDDAFDSGKSDEERFVV